MNSKLVGSYARAQRDYENYKREYNSAKRGSAEEDRAWNFMERARREMARIKELLREPA